MVTGDAIQRRLPLRMTAHAKAHVYSVNWHDSIHRLHRTMASLTFESGRDMRPMGEFHEVRELIDAVPLDLERWLLMVVPRPRDGLDTAEGAAPVASDASLHRRHARVFRSASVLVTILARDFVHPRMDTVAERNRLDYVGPRQPGAFGEKYHADAKRQKHGREGQDYAIHLCIMRSGSGRREVQR
jgi:hypothetical protein